MSINDPRHQGLIHPIIIVSVPLSVLIGWVSGAWWAGLLVLMALAGGGIFVLLRRSR
ncbi:MAG TPA: hypothetical protein PLH93_08990 [Flavobacteriales bacterium]|nr:hypothetical protein [Flavobacteriales bacterium]HQW87307.1 hypothetical protein [Flavobacteriales bacterium]